MSHPFQYQKPTDEQVKLMSDLNTYCTGAYEYLRAYVEPSAERTLAIRKLQEARLWANVAILGITL